MNVKEFEKTIQELKDKIDEEGVKVVDNDEKKRMSFVNQSWNRFVNIGTFSMMAYIAVLFLSMIIGKNAFEGLLNAHPNMVLPLQVVLAGVSVGLGTMGVNFMTGWYNVKDRIRAFSTAMSEKEKIKEEMKYALEKEKALKKAEILIKVKNILREEKEKIESISGRYNVNVVEKKYNAEGPKYDKTLNDLYAKLEQLLAKKVLDDNFWLIDSKASKVTDCVVHFFMGGGLFLMMMTFPFITVANYFASLGGLARLLFMIIPFAVGGLTVGGMHVKRTVDKTDAFRELNDELLTTFVWDFENINEEIEKVVSDIIQTEVYKLYDERGKDEKEPELIGEEMYLSLERNLASPTTVSVEEKPLVRARKNRLG